MKPQEAYEKRYAHIDGGQHTWDAVPNNLQDMWLAAWAIAWAMATQDAYAGCLRIKRDAEDGRRHGVAIGASECAAAIKRRMNGGGDE